MRSYSSAFANIDSSTRNCITYTYTGSWYIRHSVCFVHHSAFGSELILNLYISFCKCRVLSQCNFTVTTDCRFRSHDTLGEMAASMVLKLGFSSACLSSVYKLGFIFSLLECEGHPQLTKEHFLPPFSYMDDN